jgi:hypothetical protein
MPRPVTKIFYLSTGSFSGSNFPSLYESPQPVFSASAFGWNVGQNNPPLYCEMNDGVEVVRTSTQWQASPTGSLPSTNVAGSGASNSWAAGPFNGVFSSGSWAITMSVKAVTNANNQTGRFIYRFWKGGDLSGSSAALIMPTFYSSSVNVAVTGGSGTAVINSMSAVIPLPEIQFRSEYLFIQTYWSIVSAAGNNGSDEDFVFGPTASFIKTTLFVQDKPTFMKWIGATDD